MKTPRKITSDKFTVTLPKDWRESLQLRQKDIMMAHWTEGSPIIFVPDSRPLSEFEEGLVDLLINMPTPERTRAMIERLNSLSKSLEESILLTA